MGVSTAAVGRCRVLVDNLYAREGNGNTQIDIFFVSLRLLRKDTQ